MDIKNDAEDFVFLSEGGIGDMVVTEFRIFEEDYVLKVFLSLKCPRRGLMQLRFENVQEYYFNYDSSRSFYNIEEYRFMRLPETNEYYITLDPDREVNGKSDDDNDLVRAKSFSLIRY